LIDDNYGETPLFMRIHYADNWFDVPSPANTGSGFCKSANASQSRANERSLRPFTQYACEMPLLCPTPQL
jgi:hypothetical protein